MAHTHDDHTHQHGPACGHTGIKHGDHVDYLHDGHLHHTAADGTVHEHAIPVTTANPDGCATHACDAHETSHKHGPDCGHEVVPHGDHVDYLVNGHLHHPHGDHCDNHGSVAVIGKK